MRPLLLVLTLFVVVGCSGGDASNASDSMVQSAQGGLRSGPQTPKGSLPKAGSGKNLAAENAP